MLSIAGLVLILKRCSVIAKFGSAVEAQRPDQHRCLAVRLTISTLSLYRVSTASLASSWLRACADAAVCGSPKCPNGLECHCYTASPPRQYPRARRSAISSLTVPSPRSFSRTDLLRGIARCEVVRPIWESCIRMIVHRTPRYLSPIIQSLQPSNNLTNFLSTIFTDTLFKSKRQPITYSNHFCLI